GGRGGGEPIVRNAVAREGMAVLDPARGPGGLVVGEGGRSSRAGVDVAGPRGAVDLAGPRGEVRLGDGGGQVALAERPSALPDTTGSPRDGRLDSSPEALQRMFDQPAFDGARAAPMESRVGVAMLERPPTRTIAPDDVVRLA